MFDDFENLMRDTYLSKADFDVFKTDYQLTLDDLNETLA